MEKLIKRINELARKAKSSGLSMEEQAERDALRKTYIQTVTGNLRKQLDSIRYVDEQGNQYEIKGSN